MSDNIRVAIAAVFGAGSPAATWFISLEPVLSTLLTVGQIAVALVTALYIFRKWRNAKNNKNDV